MYRIPRLIHMYTRERAPRPTDSVEGLAFESVQPVETGQMLIDKTIRVRRIDTGIADGTQRAKWQRGFLPKSTVTEPHQLDATTSKVTHDPASVRNSGEHPVAG